MKSVYSFFILTFFTVFCLQAQQVENAGFENWENAGTVQDEPVDWSSIKTSDGGAIINNAAPVIWGKSTDAHSGTASVQLTNVLTLGTIVATGMITNGRVHAEFNPANGYVYSDLADPKWNTAISTRPDSVAIWVKYTPQGTDTAQVKVLLHVSDATLPPTPANQANWVGFAQMNIPGTISNWTRIVVPFAYFSPANPEHMLIILSSGAGFSPIQGSIALFDDMELIYNSNSIGEVNGEQATIYTSGSSLCLDKLPAKYFDNSNIEILSMSGTVVYSRPMSSKRIELGSYNIAEGLYIVRIIGSRASLTQKVHVR